MSASLNFAYPTQVFRFESQVQGGDINIQDNIGFTPLMEAISRNNKQAIDILLQNSADLELYDKRDRISKLECT